LKAKQPARRRSRKKRLQQTSFIAERRLALDLTQDDIARQIMISRVHMTNIENGRRSLTSGLIKPLARVLKCDPCDLLVG